MESNKSENEILKKHNNSLDEKLVLKMDEEAPLHYDPPPQASWMHSARRLLRKLRRILLHSA